MVTCKWTVAPFLLIALSAMAQEPAGQLPSSATPSTQSVISTPAPQPTTPIPAAQAAAAAPAPAQPAAGAPTTMDQVVDRAIAREHALMEALKTRMPLMETYLQNLTNDPQLGPVPKEDHYFFGRMDLADSGRQDYLSNDTSFQRRMLGGVTKLFKFEYKPLGFSWMIFADREEFDRAHYRVQIRPPRICG